MPKKKSTKKASKKTPKKESCCSVESCCSKGKVKCKHTSSCIYGLGFVGALVYYIMTATGFWNGVWGVIKALLWPAFLVFELMMHLGM